MAKYEYFISFNFWKSNGTQTGVGNSGYVLSEEITSMEQIMEIEDNIASHRKFDSCIVTNFQLLKKED